MSKEEYVPKSKRGKMMLLQERTDWKGLAREFREYPGSMGKFHRHLCEAIVLADLAGLERLRKAYPELVEELKG